MKMWSTFFLASGILCTVQAALVSDEAKSACEAARQYGAAVRNCDMAWALDSMYPPLRRIYAARLAERDPQQAAAANRRFLGSVQESDAESVARMKANDKALRAEFSRMGSEMRKQGLKVESFSVGEPSAEYIVTPVQTLARSVSSDKRGSQSASDFNSGQDRSRLVILPTTLIVSAPDKASGKSVRMERKSYIFAVRDEINSGNSTGAILKKWYFMDGNTNVNMLRSFFTNLPLNLQLPVCSDHPLR